MYCIFTEYTVADQTLKFGGGHTFLGGFTGREKNSAIADIRRQSVTRRVYGRQIFPMF